ncbi:hypothetical protein [Acinetobacter sp. CFCC 10889]|uniref:hypothetical protein n=1 Tax=Acinetobacter sp. CFCC 10889 TaxID=1775557 RepID=UPI000DD04756|nr:hypothetical protein [Acinetobacter sp. CFCC 10889]
MALYKAQGYDLNVPITVQASGLVVSQRVVVGFLAVTALAANDVILLGELPQDYVLTDVEIDLEQVVAGATVDVGILNEAETAVEFSLINAGSLATAGYVSKNSTKALRNGRFDKKRVIGAVVKAGGSAAAGTKIGFTIKTRNAQSDE